MHQRVGCVHLINGFVKLDRISPIQAIHKMANRTHGARLVVRENIHVNIAVVWEIIHALNASIKINGQSNHFAKLFEKNGFALRQCVFCGFHIILAG
jgi:hypothetical protein